MTDTYLFFKQCNMYTNLDITYTSIVHSSTHPKQVVLTKECLTLGLWNQQVSQDFAPFSHCVDNPI